MSNSATVHREDVERGLHDLGVSEGAAVEVHCALSSFGHVEGGADTVLDAILAVVGTAGTVVMSAYPVTRGLPLDDADRARGISWKVRVLPESSQEKSGMGSLVEEFCRRPGVVLGTGLHRVAAWGAGAARHAERGYQSLLDVDGRALLLGVGIDRCSSLHLSDGIALPAALQSYFAIPETVRRAYPDDIVFGYHEPPECPWDKALEAMAGRGDVSRRRIGPAECTAFRVRPMLEAIEDIIKMDPLRAFGLEELAGDE